MAKRLLVRDQQGERERLLVGTMTVGRDTRCDISDADPLLSRRHAEFVCRPDSLVIRDLNSRNGVVVNGVKVQEAVLRPGDVVKVARMVMTYLGDHDSARPPSESAPVLDLPLRPPPAARAPSTRAEPPRPGGYGPAADIYGRRPPDTEKVPIVPQDSSGAHGMSPGDDRTRVVPRGSGPSASGPGQVAVARLTPSPLHRPSQPAAEPDVEDADKTTPVVRPDDERTDDPDLLPPASGSVTSGPAPPARVSMVQPAGIRRIDPPPIVAAPPAPAPVGDLPVDPGPRPAGPRPVEAQPRPAAGRGPGAGRVFAASTGLAAVVFALTAVPMVVWMTSHRDVPPIPWNFFVVLGPSLLGSLAAGLVLAWWLRRTGAGG